MTDEVLGGNAQAQLRSIVERWERLEVEKAEVAEQIKELAAEAKGNGFDVKILRKVIRIRKQDRAKRMEEEAVTDLYLTATGDLLEAFTHAYRPKAKPPVEDEEEDLT